MKRKIIGLRISDELYYDLKKAIENYNKKNKYSDVTITSICKKRLIEFVKENL